MFDHTVSNPAMLGGEPRIKVTRISVRFILGPVASGASRGEIVKTCPHLRAEEVAQARHHGAESLKADVVPSAEAGGCA